MLKVRQKQRLFAQWDYSRDPCSGGSKSPMYVLKGHEPRIGKIEAHVLAPRGFKVTTNASSPEARDEEAERYGA
jgi:hypothetical protein